MACHRVVKRYDSMLKICLTGAIGSGKSRVADLFAKLDVPIIDTDVIARQVVEPNTAALKKMINYFGTAIVDEKGQLLRKKLGEIVFNNNEKRQWLEDLLHPLIRQTVQQQIDTLNTPYCIIVIPLLKPDSNFTFIDRVLVVDCNESLQKQRVLERDNINDAQFTTIAQAQIDRQTRLQLADDVIINESDITHLQQQVKKLDGFYRSLIESDS